MYLYIYKCTLHGAWEYSGTCIMRLPMGPSFFGWIRQVAALERCLLIFIVKYYYCTIIIITFHIIMLCILYQQLVQ